MRFPFKKLLLTVASICLLGLLNIGILKPLNNKEDSGTANNVTDSHLARVVLDLDSETGASQKNQTEVFAQNLDQLPLPFEIPPVEKETKNETHRKFPNTFYSVKIWGQLQAEFNLRILIRFMKCMN